MKSLHEIILEKLKIRKSSYYFPKTKEELRDILKELIKERGNEGDFNDIDTSEITDMSYLFGGMIKFNGDISEWDVSNVTDMTCMFYECRSFNQDISKWDVSNVTNMQHMFYRCKSFNQPLNTWNVSNVRYYDDIFFNCPIEEKNYPRFR